FPGYGKLAKRKLEDMVAGSRIEVDARKRHPADFALWKSSKPGEPAWDSPWGPGRPGWHIECSVMSTKYLGQPFDIHGGGTDLIFPHHENEIAQSEGAAGCAFARYWVHNGMVTINQEKMSKSLGNFMTVQEAAGRAGGEAVRLFVLGTHYRSPLDFAPERLDESARALTRLYETLARCDAATPTAAAAQPEAA
ncbi:cysteine--tRNA ligase, partial [Myxococcota bacterium]|nr:cysteine--tRNA ligase [Myxococcota bacterium]